MFNSTLHWGSTTECLARLGHTRPGRTLADALHRIGSRNRLVSSGVRYRLGTPGFNDRKGADVTDVCRRRRELRLGAGIQVEMPILGFPINDDSIEFLLGSSQCSQVCSLAGGSMSSKKFPFFFCLFIITPE